MQKAIPVRGMGERLRAILPAFLYQVIIYLLSELAVDCCQFFNGFEPSFVKNI